MTYKRDGSCCLREHANAKAPWTCPCKCHEVKACTKDPNTCAHPYCEWPRCNTDESGSRLELAEVKLREMGIIWEEGKGYVYDGNN
jgi:hypothetical protein